MWPAFCGRRQPSSGKNRVPKLYFVDRCELCVLEWGSMGETMKAQPLWRFQASGSQAVGVWTRQLEALIVWKFWMERNGQGWVCVF